jgi:Ca-activated chloride channel family protein
MEQRRRSRVPLVIAAVVGIGLVALLRNVFEGGGDGGGSSATAKPQAGCTSLSVVGSSEKAALLQGIAADYQKADRRVRGRCVRVQVTSKSSGGAAEALARGWDDAVDGVRPDVWSPASSSWVVILRQRLAERDLPGMVPDSIPHVAETPLVIAMPRPMAQALGWPDKAIGWSDVLSLSRDPAGWGKLNHPEWGAFRLGKTNPNFSTSGLNATIGAFFAATGRSSDLTEADLGDAKVIDFVKGVESSVVHYGDITLTFLQNLLEADDRGAGLSYISAVTVEEKSVWDYNKGNPSGDPKTLGKHAPPKTPLVAIYPKEGTLLSDNPYTVLTAPWVDDAKKAAAADFLKFLQAPDQQRRFQAAAFRDFKGGPGGEIKQSNGLLPGQPAAVIAPPPPTVLDKIQKSWAVLRKKARVLLVIDVSGSMGEAVPKAGTSKLELAKQAAIRAVDQLAPEDELGLWIFSSDLQAGKPYLELVPISPVGQRVAEVKQKISSLAPRTGTALYATAREASRRMRASFDASRINAIVLLTDGRNEYPPDTDLAGLLRELRSEGEDVAVRVFPIAYGEDADLPTLRQIAEASRAAAYDASDPASIDKVFTAVISNF